MQTLNLGDKVRDRVTGLEGILTGKTFWLNGCVRGVIQGRVDKDGKVPQSEGVDIEQLELVEAGACTIEKEPTGGPMPMQSRPETPKP